MGKRLGNGERRIQTALTHDVAHGHSSILNLAGVSDASDTKLFRSKHSLPKR